MLSFGCFNPTTRPVLAFRTGLLRVHFTMLIDYNVFRWFFSRREKKSNFGKSRRVGFLDFFGGGAYRAKYIFPWVAVDLAQRKS